MKTATEWGAWADDVWLKEHRHVSWGELIEAVQADAIGATSQGSDKPDVSPEQVANPPAQSKRGRADKGAT